MNDSPRLGLIVQVLAGRDAGRRMVVVGLHPPEYLTLADGDLRKIARPKRKKLKHLRPLGIVVEGIEERIASGKLTDAQLRKALSQTMEHKEEGVLV